MLRTLASAFRVATILTAVVALLWVTLIAVPMWLTRWRMSRLLADYHSIFPTQTTGLDAQRLMTRWGRWGHYEGTCSSSECDYSIRMSDTYVGLIEKLSKKNQLRIYNFPFLKLASRIGYRTSEMDVHFLVLNEKIVRNNISMMMMVEDSGPPDHFTYPILILVGTRSNLSEYPRFPDREPGVMRVGVAQLDLHPDYLVYRPSSPKVGIIDRITYTPTLSHETLVQLTGFNLACLTQWHPCLSVGDLLPFGRGWQLWEGGPSSLYPTSSSSPLACRTEPRALARDAATVLEVEVLNALPTFRPYADWDHRRELVRARILHAWKSPLRDTPGSIIEVTPFAGEEAYPPYRPAILPEHLLPNRRAFLFLPESGPAVFGPDSASGVFAYSLERCAIIDDTPSNLAAIQLGMAQDVPYRHP
jgi:hypothetical protein